jgi:MYXO-CTERM domain-containing protein
VGALLSSLVVSGTAFAHVGFVDPPPVNDNDPNQPMTPAKVLKIGSKFTVKWQVLILHDPEDFDLDLLEKRDGAATTIVHGLSPDTLEYEWTVPDMPCTDCFLRVTQNNTINSDYTDFAPVTLSADGGTASSSAGAGGKSSGKAGSSSTGGSSSSAGGSGNSTSGSDSAAGEPATTSGSAGKGSSDSGSDGGCSIAAQPNPGGRWGWALAGLAAFGCFRRRSRRPGAGFAAAMSRR